MARLAIAVALVLACLGTYSTVSACQVLVNSTAYVDLTPISLQYALFWPRFSSSSNASFFECLSPSLASGSSFFDRNWFATGNSPYNYLLNPCKTLTYDAVQMPEGNAFCNDTARVCQITSTGPAFLVGNQYLATSTGTHFFFPSLRARVCAHPQTGTTTTVTISGGSYCQNLGVYRKAVINFSCGTTLVRMIVRLASLVSHRDVRTGLADAHLRPVVHVHLLVDELRRVPQGRPAGR